MRIGPRMPPDARRSRPHTSAEQQGGEGQHHVAGGQGRDAVGERRPERPATAGWRHRPRPRKKSSSAIPLTVVISDQDRQGALVGVVDDRDDLASSGSRHGDLLDQEGADDEDAGQQRPDRDRGRGRAGVPVPERDPAQVQAPRRERADRPDAGQPEGRGVEPAAAGVDAQREAEGDRAEQDEPDRDQLTAAQRRRLCPAGRAGRRPTTPGGPTPAAGSPFRSYEGHDAWLSDDRS